MCSASRLSPLIHRAGGSAQHLFGWNRHRRPGGSGLSHQRGRPVGCESESIPHILDSSRVVMAMVPYKYSLRVAQTAVFGLLDVPRPVSRFYKGQHDPTSASMLGRTAVDQQTSKDHVKSRVNEKVILVTGGARGMGAAHARLLVAEGAKVVITDVRHTEGEALAAQLGTSALYVRQDVSEPEEWCNAIASAESRFGALHGLVNNAGIASIAPIEQFPLD
ncbi:hypothetical protein ACVJGD_007794 [Bradyrhizobium sp. USDA 10063]